jgi:hypothetical protein
MGELVVHDNILGDRVGRQHTRMAKEDGDFGQLAVANLTAVGEGKGCVRGGLEELRGVPKTALKQNAASPPPFPKRSCPGRLTLRTLILPPKLPIKALLVSASYCREVHQAPQGKVLRRLAFAVLDTVTFLSWPQEMSQPLASSWTIAVTRPVCAAMGRRGKKGGWVRRLIIFLGVTKLSTHTQVGLDHRETVKVGGNGVLLTKSCGRSRLSGAAGAEPY